MRIGEMKAQALMLMYPDAPVRFDSTDDFSVENTLHELKCNPNYEGLLESAVGSINRAFSVIEARGLSLTKCHDISSSVCDKRGDGRIVIKTMDDFLSVETLLCHDDHGKTFSCPYQLVGDTLITDHHRGIFTLIYKTTIPRISSVTKESYKPILQRGVGELIPYFIKADLFSQENEEEARLCRELFNKGLDAVALNSKIQCHQCFQTIYSME